jgi:hypothetical protein
MHLCRACYRFVDFVIVHFGYRLIDALNRQVHELHPSHPFLIIPDKPEDTILADSDYDPTLVPNPHEELCK